jgi:predicted HTH transcriptional regulator
VQAVTETIVNACVHRDYLSTGSVQVMLFKDRLEVWNPGRLPKGMTVEKLAGEHASLPVNPLLANPVYLAGYIEQVGTGTNDVIDRCVELGLRKPEFRQDEDFTVVMRRKEYLTETSSTQVTGQVAGQVTGQVRGQVREPVRRLILALAGQTLTRKQMMTLLSLKGRDNFRVNYLEPSMAEGLVLKLYPESETFISRIVKQLGK